MIKRLLFLAVAAFPFQSCYYDKLNEIHPNATDPCDSALAATYAKSIRLIVANNCISCHSGSAPSGAIKLETFTDVTTVAQNGLLSGTIRQSSGYKPMPPDSKIRDCEIQKIETWITNGLPEN